MNRLMRIVLALMLVIASGSAAALGLGQIQLKSKLGEPLLAEIPIISSDPSELENLHAGLASPETFARIGLALPEGIVANLQFVPALDSAGRPIIRVTSTTPINEPLLTFLVEVDWGQGRLVREYSTLMDAPRTVAATSQPTIQGPVQAPSNAIVRDPTSAPADDFRPDGVANSDDIRQSGEVERTVDARAPAAQPAARSVSSQPGRYGAVQRGEYLSNIAAGLDMGGNLQQKMIALLQANPQAFIDGNINLIKQGAVLRIPDADEVAAISAAQAAAQVREQTRTWRAATQPVPQPQMAGVDGAAGRAPSSDPKVAGTTAAADGARLEIVPPGASNATRAGTQSGITAGGEGDMVRQDLQVTQETLAARDAELAEMKSRIETLEQLQTDQQKLLAMKDSELASAQQQLAQSQLVDSGQAGSAMPWLLGGSALVLVLIGAWWLRRKADAAPKFRAPVSASRAPSSLADGFPSAPSRPDAPTDVAVLNPQPLQPAAPVSVADATTADQATATPPVALTSEPEREPDPQPELVYDAEPEPELIPAPMPNPAVPVWHSGTERNTLNSPAPAADPVIAELPSQSISSADSVGSSDAPGMDRLELARAYLDLGDHDSARQLLGELVVSGGLEARQQATRLLRDLG